MTKNVIYRGEEFLIDTDTISMVSEEMSKGPLTPYRIEMIKHKIENSWINTNIIYTKGGNFFSDKICEYYIKYVFEIEFKTSIN